VRSIWQERGALTLPAQRDLARGRHGAGAAFVDTRGVAAAQAGNMADEPPGAPRANDRALPRLGDRLWRLLWRIRNWLTRGR